MSGDLWVSLTVGIRFEEIEQLLQRNDDSNAATISIPIHLLHKGRQLVEWNAARPDIADLLEEQVELYAIPFFEQMASLESLKSQLMEEIEAQQSRLIQATDLNSQQQKELRLKLMHSKHLKLPLTPDQRTEILAAIAAVKGDLISAQSIIHHAKLDLERAKSFHLPSERFLLRRATARQANTRASSEGAFRRLQHAAPLLPARTG